MIGFRRTQALKYISAADPALDTERTDLARYLSTGDFEQFVKVREGMTPTVFHVKRLTRGQYTYVAGKPPHEQDAAAVAFAVENVDNFQLASGQALVCKFVGDGEDKRLSGETLNAMFAPMLFAELGKVILVVSNLDPLDVSRFASSPG